MAIRTLGKEDEMKKIVTVRQMEAGRMTVQVIFKPFSQKLVFLKLTAGQTAEIINGYFFLTYDG